MVPDTTKQAALIADKYPQGDLFICDVADAVLKDIMPELEHPFYSLSKKPETRIRRYEHGDNWLEVIPSVKGLATIYDKDILIYCISQIMAKLNDGEEVSKRVRINSADLLRFTNRGVSGRDYMALRDALDRIRGTTITTNVRTGDEEQLSSFGLIESHSMRRKFGLDGRLMWCEITLSDWVFNAIQANEVLTLNRDYFRLRKPIERRLYELARKHCGQQPTWSCGMDTLYKKSGSQGTLRKFRFSIKDIVEIDHLPDYRLSYDEEKDQVTFTNRSTMPLDKPKSFDGLISPSAFETVSKLKLNTDKYLLEQEFRDWVASKQIKPEKPDAMFVQFAKTKKQKETG